MGDVEYSITENGEVKGPFKWDALQKLVWDGKLTAKTPVWKLGMDNWVECGTVTELQGLFAPPPLPKASAPPPLPGAPPPIPAGGIDGGVFE
jgi:hypothetical protein